MKMDNNEYPVMTVGTQGSETQTTYPASIKGVQDVEIRPKVSGFITKLCVQEGQVVKAGQLLFVIDNTTYQATVRQAQAALNSAKVQLNTTKLTFDNSKKLFRAQRYRFVRTANGAERLRKRARCRGASAGLAIFGKRYVGLLLCEKSG